MLAKPARKPGSRRAPQRPGDQGLQSDATAGWVTSPPEAYALLRSNKHTPYLHPCLAGPTTPGPCRVCVCMQVARSQPSYSTHAQRSALRMWLRRFLVRLRLDLCCSSQVRRSQATVRRQPCAGAGTALRCVRVADGAHHCHCDSHRLAFTNVVVKW